MTKKSNLRLLTHGEVVETGTLVQGLNGPMAEQQAAGLEQ